MPEVPDGMGPERLGAAANDAGPGRHAAAGRARHASRRGGRAAPPAPSSEPRGRRLTIVALLAGLLVLGGLLDRVGSSGPAVATPVPPVPVAAPASALSSSWFCAGASTQKGGDDTGTLVIANTRSVPLTATVTLVPSQGWQGKAPAPATVAVGPRSRVTVPESLPGGPAGVGAIVDLDGGAAAVEQQVSGPLGTATSPCATSGSPTWYFPTGTTLRDASDTVSLLNPYPGVAIVNLSFVTDEGAEQPGDYQAVAVPGRSLVEVNLRDHLRRREHIATTVTATAGRVVAWQTLAITPPSAGTPVVDPTLSGSVQTSIDDPAPPVGGITLSLGAPSPGTQWWWPDGVAARGVSEQYVIVDPGPAPAQLRLTFNLDNGGSEALPVTVGPAGVVNVVTNSEAQIPQGVAHSASLVSVNGVPVVAERSVSATSPSPRSGIGVLLGGRMAATQWLLAGGQVQSSIDEWVEVQNPGSKAVTASISQLSGALVPQLGRVTVPAGGRLAVQVAAHVGPSLDSGLVVRASGPVVVERDLYGSSGTPGVALALGVPLQP